jgi:predicted dehydrogenase
MEMKTDTIIDHVTQLSQSRPIKVGVVGLGYWGPKLARNFHSLPGAVLHYAADLRDDRLADLRKLYPEVSITNSYEDMLASDIDAVVIATPVSTHFHLAKKALLAKKHVLVEKPLTRDSLQARELIELANYDGGLTLMVGHTFVYNPAVEAVRDIIQSGELGDICYMDSVRVNLGLLQPDINVMWDLAPHDLSLIGFILGARPLKVSAIGRVYVNTSRNLPEVAYLNIIYENDVMANLRVSWLDPVKQRRLTVVGCKKMLVYDDIADNKVTIFDKGVEVPPYSVTEEEFKASYRQGPETPYPIQWVEPLKAECLHFVDCIRSGKTPRSSSEDGLMVVRILETAQISLDNGGVELKI